MSQPQSGIVASCGTFFNPFQRMRVVEILLFSCLSHTGFAHHVCCVLVPAHPLPWQELAKHATDGLIAHRHSISSCHTASLRHPRQLDSLRLPQRGRPVCNHSTCDDGAGDGSMDEGLHEEDSERVLEGVDNAASSDQVDVTKRKAIGVVQQAVPGRTAQVPAVSQTRKHSGLVFFGSGNSPTQGLCRYREVLDASNEAACLHPACPPSLPPGSAAGDGCSSDVTWPGDAERLGTAFELCKGRVLHIGTGLTQTNWHLLSSVAQWLTFKATPFIIGGDFQVEPSWRTAVGCVQSAPSWWRRRSSLAFHRIVSFTSLSSFETLQERAKPQVTSLSTLHPIVR